MRLRVRASEVRPGDLLIARLKAGDTGSEVRRYGWRVNQGPVRVFNGAYFTAQLHGEGGQFIEPPQDAPMEVERE